MPPRGAPRRGQGQRGGFGPAGPGRGGGAGRGGTRVVNIAESVRTIGVRRPGYGTGGREVQTIVNAFPVDVPDEMIYHYDVAITPDKLPARMNMKLYGRLQEMVPAYRTAVYDTRKNIYTIDELPLGPSDAASYDVTLEPEGPPSERPPKVFKIKVTKVAEINTELLHRFIAGQQTLDNPIFTAIMAFNVVIRMRPNEKHPFNVRSFFVPQGKRPIGRGIELWHGYFQSVRPTQNRMYINLDIATGVMYRDGPLINVCLDFFGRLDPNNPNPNMLSTRANFPDRERLRLQRFLSGLRVITNHGGRTRAYVVKKVTAEGAAGRTFTTREGQTQTVANYFRTTLGITLRFPDVVCVEVGSGAVIPLELCTVPAGQIMRKQIPPDKTSEVVDFARLRPDQRLNTIRQGLQLLQYGQSPYIRQFGMNITEEAITVKARVLEPPMLRYGDASRQTTIRPQNGQWNMRDKKFFVPKSVKQWIIVVYETERYFPLVDAQDMANAFCEGADSVGMTIEERRPLIFYENGQGNIGEQLRADGKRCYDAKKTPPDLIVVVLPEGGNQIYTAVKHFGDVTMGVVTQCLKSRKCKGAKMQYWANVMLKLNAKLGGINNILQANAALRDPNNPTIVMGADVIHPAPGADGRPSFTTLVGSIDDTTALYTAESRVQTGRVEIIEDLQEMCKAVIRTYAGYQKRKGPPTRLIFYRDGVSEGQFQQVLDDELPLIKNACQEMKMNPKITLIIVGKRHHIRMFPQNRGDADNSGNCQAGTTIDEGLGHPTEFDYYQLTHGGLLGTSRPAHYSVIYDDNNFQADAIQELSFALCHVYARATRSVSIPAPVYYADIVCSRAKNHYTPGGGIDLSETGTQISNADDQLEAMRQAYRPLHANMARRMYFM